MNPISVKRQEKGKCPTGSNRKAEKVKIPCRLQSRSVSDSIEGNSPGFVEEMRQCQYPAMGKLSLKEAINARN